MQKVYLPPKYSQRPKFHQTIIETSTKLNQRKQTVNVQNTNIQHDQDYIKSDRSLKQIYSQSQNLDDEISESQSVSYSQSEVEIVRAALDETESSTRTNKNLQNDVPEVKNVVIGINRQANMTPSLNSSTSQQSRRYSSNTSSIVTNVPQDKSQNSNNSSENSRMKFQSFQVLNPQSATFRAYYAQVKQKLKNCTTNSALLSGRQPLRKIKDLKSFKNTTLSRSQNESMLIQIRQTRAATQLKDSLTGIFRVQYRFFFDSYKQSLKEKEIIEMFTIWHNHQQQQIMEIEKQQYMQQQIGDISQISDIYTRKMSVNPLSDKDPFNSRRFSQQQNPQSESFSNKKDMSNMNNNNLLHQSFSQNQLQSFSQSNNTQYLNELQQQQQQMYLETFRQRNQNSRQDQQMQTIHREYLNSQITPQQWSQKGNLPQQQSQYFVSNNNNNDNVFQRQTPYLQSNPTNKNHHNSSSDNKIDASMIDQITKKIKKDIMKTLQSKGILGSKGTQINYGRGQACRYQCHQQQSLQESFLTDENSSFLSDSQQKHHQIQKVQHSNIQHSRVRLQDITNIVQNHKKGKNQNIQQYEKQFNTTSNKEVLSPKLLEKIKQLLPSPPQTIKQNQCNNNIKRSACIQTELNQNNETQKWAIQGNNQTQKVIQQEAQNYQNLQAQQKQFLKAVKSQKLLNEQRQMMTLTKSNLDILETCGTATFRDMRDDKVHQQSSRYLIQDSSQKTLNQSKIDSQRRRTMADDNQNGKSSRLNQNNYLVNGSESNIDINNYIQTQRSAFAQALSDYQEQSIVTAKQSSSQQSNNHQKSFTKHQNYIVANQISQNISPTKDNLTSLDITTNAQKDYTCLEDPAADLSLVMYNTGTMQEFQKTEEQNDEDLSNPDENINEMVLNQEQLRTLTMFETGFKTFFPVNSDHSHDPRNNQNQNANQKRQNQKEFTIKECQDQSINFNSNNNGMVTATVSRYFNDDCDDISEIQASSNNKFLRGQFQFFKRNSIEEATYCNSQHNISNLTQNLPQHNEIKLRINKNQNSLKDRHHSKKKSLIKGQNEECSFEYSKAEDMQSSQILNESSFDQFISDMSIKKRHQDHQSMIILQNRQCHDQQQKILQIDQDQDQQNQNNFYNSTRVNLVPKLALDKLEQQYDERRDKAKQALKNIVLNSIGL
ncbi:UNKNOWN [Stylonychia lemnae]|uniref:Uncharacterized protein n=1 Tax=Stylonychia lemnae TaxID=5949 RepID=A0A077ZVA1_STYLE|nr:UNKNOWN [Stylonychia lemnae]|eukprot:CDW73820.1 UNKNOWN [Stylonychia lemnae]